MVGYLSFSSDFLIMAYGDIRPIDGVYCFENERGALVRVSDTMKVEVTNRFTGKTEIITASKLPNYPGTVYEARIHRTPPGVQR